MLIPSPTVGGKEEEMKVMTLHNWFDLEVECVKMAGDGSTREIILSKDSENSLLLNKDDVVALAKEFGFVVYPKDANL